jgi:hypothetical protein
MDRGIWLKDYLRAVSLVSAYAALGTISLLVFRQFFDVMLPRIQAVLVQAPIANTPPCGAPDCDFSVFWPAGLLAKAGRFGQAYQPDQFLAWRHQILFAGAQRLDWFYPPPTLLPVLAISHLPFHTAFIVWTAGFIACAALLLRWAGLSWPVLLLGLVSPAALWTIEMGQFEILADAILVAGLLMAARSPARAGGLLGLLVIKPQAALLVPIAMLASGNRRAIAGGVVVVCALLATTTLVFGPEIWTAYLADGPATSRLTLTSNTVGFERGVSVFWMARSFGAGLPACYLAQGVASLCAIGMTWRIWRDGVAEPIQRMALTVFLALLVTPFGYVDDMVGWSVALAALAERRGWRIGLLDALFWLWPALCPIVTNKTGLLFTPAIVALAVLRTYHAGQEFAAPSQRRR